MKKVEEAKEILSALGLPDQQQNEISCFTLLALCNIKEDDNWKNAFRKSLTVTKGIMNFVKEDYNKDYAPNTRETFRRQVLHQFVQARIADYNPDAPNLPVNSPNAHYAISKEALEVIKNYKSNNWNKSLKKFVKQIGTLKDKYEKTRNFNKIPVLLSNGNIVTLSVGKHNQVEASVIKEFAPRFAKTSKVIYLGDTENKDLYFDKNLFFKLNIIFNEHSKLPDIILFNEEKNLLFMIEVVTSHGPVTPKRIIEMDKMTEKCDAKKIYISAFPDFKEFKRHISEIAWETEVWIADIPDHMIHYNGDKFLNLNT